MKTKGLRQRISVAESTSDIDLLVLEGRKFDMASNSTRRAWKSTANKRRTKLSGVSPPAIVTVPEETVELPKKRKVKKKS